MIFKKKIMFISGTRADYGKIKPLMSIIDKSKSFILSIVVTGMHLSKIHGETIFQIKNDFPKSEIFKFKNKNKTMDLVLSDTIYKLNKIIKKNSPHLIVAHGDRVEALASAIVGYLNNVLVCHIEGGEISGTVDDSMRHATSKLSHIHFVSNSKAKNVLSQLGEIKKNIHVIGSPEVDTMLNNKLPNIKEVKKKYNIDFKKYCIICFHPDVYEKKVNLKKYIEKIIRSLLNSKKKYVVIYPNNDQNYQIILEAYKKIKKNKNFKFIPSMRFEYYLSLLKNSDCIIGNSSSGVREAPVYKVKTINIGNRQRQRTSNPLIINYNLKTIPNNVDKVIDKKLFYNKKFSDLFGDGSSNKKFQKVISSKSFWKIQKDKLFKTMH